MGKAKGCLPSTLPLFMPGDKLKFLLTYFLRRENSGRKERKAPESRTKNVNLSRLLSAIPSKRWVGESGGFFTTFANARWNWPVPLPFFLIPIQTTNQAGGAPAIIICWCSRRTGTPGNAVFHLVHSGQWWWGGGKSGGLDGNGICSLPHYLCIIVARPLAICRLPSQQKIIFY